MGEKIIAESSTTVFGRVFEDLHDDCFEGSMHEQKIFNEVFFGSDGGMKKGVIVSEATVVYRDHVKQRDMSLCSNSGNSSLTRQGDLPKEFFAGKHPLQYPCKDLSSLIISNRKMKLSVEDLPDVKPGLGDTLFVSAPSEGVISSISQEDSGSVIDTLAYRVVESSVQGITSSSYQLKPLVYLDKRCQISGRVSPNNKISSLEQNDQKEAANRAVTSPISQESYASRLLMNDQPVSIPNKLGNNRPTKPKWKDSCFLELDEDEFAMPKDVKNDPRPLLRYHINRLLRAAGWVIGRRKRNSKYNGIGEYVYKSPGGRPIREFHRAWCMCGESLLTDAISFKPTSDCMQWNDMNEFWTDLSHIFKEIEDKLNLLENTDAMAHLWCLLDPFVNVVFIEKIIRLLKEGIEVKAKRSFVIPSDAGSAAKYRKISERIRLNARPLQEGGYGGTIQSSVDLSDVPISSGAPKLLEGPEGVIPHQDSCTNSSNFDQTKIEAEFGSSHITKGHKRSRKISEMKLSGNRFGTRGDSPIGKTSSVTHGSKKSKACGLNDDDLLISAIIKTKTCKASNKWSTRKSKPLRKRKTPKGSCRLLPRSLKKGAKHIVEGNWFAAGSRTVLSWLIHSGVVSLNEVIQYRNLKDDVVIKDGLVTRNGISCNCCNNLLSISEFKSHAGFRLDRPCMNLFMESGKPFSLCQLEAWSAEYKARKVAPKTDQVDELDQNDDSCGRCGDVGELICCDNCPSAFHQACLFEQELPEGNWYCPQCRCQICEDVVNDKETLHLHGALKCSQCEHKYHETCMQQKGMKVELASDTWFCGDSCHKVYTGLRSRIGLRNLLCDGFSWTLLRCIPGDQKVHSVHRDVALKAECNSKLAVAITIMEECFLPMIDMKTGIDMIPQVIYNWESQFTRLNYNGFYTVVLEKDDVVLSVASIRVHGVAVAELPLVATCSKIRRQGMCRRLINSIEEMLKSLKVEKIVVSAIPSLVETWTVGFGFQPLEEDERESLSKTNLMVFPGAVWLKKPLYENPSATERNESNENMTLDDSTVGAYEKGPNTEHISEIIKHQPPEYPFEERDLKPSVHSSSVKETDSFTTNGGAENVAPDQEKECQILADLDRQECREVADCNAPIEESGEKNNAVAFLDELSKHSDDVHDHGVLRNPVPIVTSNEIVALPKCSQVNAEPEILHTGRSTMLS